MKTHMHTSNVSWRRQFRIRQKAKEAIQMNGKKPHFHLHNNKCIILIMNIYVICPTQRAGLVSLNLVGPDCYVCLKGICEQRNS